MSISRSFSRVFGVVVLSPLVAASARGIGLLNTSQALPGNLKNNVVRLHTEVNGLAGVKKDAGSGLVLEQKNDKTGNGAWICILTADHVLLAADKIGLGFGDGISATMVQTSTLQLYRGPGTDDSRIDLAVLGFHVDDRTKLPTFGAVTIAAPKKNDAGVLAGYGAGGSVVEFNEGPSYLSDKKFGTYRSGKDTIDAVGVDGGPVEFSQGLEVCTYKFKALEGTLAFGPNKPPRTSGDAYILGGDSGGPTFVGSSLVGIHSYADIRDDGDKSYGDEGGKWTDVQVSEYKDFIKKSCDAVPEPAPVVALGLGLTALVKRRRK